MLRGHGEIPRVSELSVEERVGDVVVKTPLTAVFISEVVEVTAHVVGQREQPTVCVNSMCLPLTRLRPVYVPARLRCGTPTITGSVRGAMLLLVFPLTLAST